MINYALHEHKAPGFPGVALKWHEEHGAYVAPYVTVRGLIRPWSWEDGQGQVYASIEAEKTRFETWVRQVFAEDASVQG
jgi:hypothetical protein